ncbi:MAG: hypothetical protein KAJ33_03010 [Thermoplasmata archaeon]|nr:hypothetical protein [Thermoplasmata archaeon]
MLDEDKGKLLYRTPKALFRKQLNRARDRKSYFLFGIGMATVAAIMLPAVIMYEGSSTPGLEIFLFPSMVVLLVLMHISTLSYYISDKLTIYENGFSLPRKPLEFILKKEEYYFSFKDIQEVKYDTYGMAISMKLTNDEIIFFGISNRDYEGFIELSKQLEKLPLQIKKPNMKVVFDYMNAHSRWLRGEISKKAKSKYFERMASVNNEFAR